MNVLPALYAFILFYVLTPNVLVRIPLKGSKYIAAAVHAALFAIVWVVTFRYVGKFEGATTMSGTGPVAPSKATTDKSGESTNNNTSPVNIGKSMQPYIPDILAANEKLPKDKQLSSEQVKQLKKWSSLSNSQQEKLLKDVQTNSLLHKKVMEIEIKNLSPSPSPSPSKKSATK
jgi:hypothetical protein